MQRKVIGSMTFRVKIYVGIVTVPGCFLLHSQTISKLILNCARSDVFFIRNAKFKVTFPAYDTPGNFTLIAVSSTSRRHKAIALSTKIAIIDAVEESTKLISRIEDSFGLPKSTVSKIIKNKEKLGAVYENNTTGK